MQLKHLGKFQHKYLSVIALSTDIITESSGNFG
jgi:hypothetical protein